MILLTSDGITSPQLEEEIKKALVPISRRAALVTTASCRYKEKDHNVPVLSALMRRFGLEPECVDVEFQDATFLLAVSGSYDCSSNSCIRTGLNGDLHILQSSFFIG